MTNKAVVKGFSGQSSDAQKAMNRATESMQQWIDKIFKVYAESDSKVTITSTNQSSNAVIAGDGITYFTCFILVVLNVEYDEDQLLAC